MKKTSIIVALGALLTGLAPGYAHHSFAIDFDFDNLVTIEGIVTEVWWQNPHARIYLEVQNDDGGVETWEVETLNINRLHRRGWRSDTLVLGQRLAASGNLARNGSNRLFLRVVVLEDGSELRPSPAAD